MNKQQEIFDEKLVRQRRKRAWRIDPDLHFLAKEVGARLLDRLSDINRDFTAPIDLGGYMAQEHYKVAAPDKPPFIHDSNYIATGYDTITLDAGSADLIISNLVLHSVNDLVGTLIQINKSLKPDGLFLGAMFGGETLFELRHSLLSAEAEITDRAYPRVAPFGDIRDLGGLLGRAGFALPVADLDRITVSYEHPLKLMQDLRLMGETNALVGCTRNILRRDVMMRACEIYMANHRSDDGRVRATFDIIYLTGWHPHESQQQPLKPGSKAVNLNEVFTPYASKGNTDE